MKILIVEDEKAAADRLRSLIKKYDANIEILAVLDTVKAAAQWLLLNPPPDLIFLDIQLADGLSFEIFDITEVNAPVIFTTAYDEYAIKAFKVNSIDYLLKPLDYNDFARALNKYNSLHQPVKSINLNPLLEQLQKQVEQLAPQYKNRFVIKIGDHLKSISVDDILYLFSKEKVTYVVTTDGKRYIMDQTLEKMEMLLDPKNFFRINRQYILTMHCIKDIISYSNSRLKIIVKSCDDQDVLVSRERVQDFKLWLDS
ncbi:LytTR family DNA-binding domain-containing protein [soil metagenome]